MKENSLHVKLENVSKRFLSEWIFKNINLSLEPGKKLAVLGSNGSGKSTFLQCVAYFQEPSKGKIDYSWKGNLIKQSQYYKFLSCATPYMELIEEFNFIESVQHQKVFKGFLPALTEQKILEISGLDKKQIEKPIKLYSSGMKQRAKLTLAILADAPLLLLDEPCSNLDDRAITWYGELIREYANHKTIIVCSNNIVHEFNYCSDQINILDFKL